MVLSPTSGLGRVLLAIIIISTVAYLTLNIVSFAGTRWITYRDVPVRFGLWRVCDTTTSGLCNQWSDDNFKSSITNATFNGDKPGFIRSSQALEIISLIFYVIAAILIIIGIIDLDAFPFELAFSAAAVLLFISIVFISATLGLMSKKGRNNHPFAFLDWAWWNGLVGLIMTIICFLSLILYIVHKIFSNSSGQKANFSKKQKNIGNNNVWGQPGSYSMGMPGSPPPAVVTTHFQGHQQSHYPNYNHHQHHQQQHNYYPNNHWQQQHSNQFYQNPMLTYGNQSAAEQYYHEQSPSPMISELARQYVTQAHDAQYQRQLLDPYRQYLHDPYLIHNYL